MSNIYLQNEISSIKTVYQIIHILCVMGLVFQGPIQHQSKIFLCCPFNTATAPQLYSKTFLYSSLSLFSTCFDVFLSFYPAKSIAKIGNVRQSAPPAAFPTDFARWTQSIMREMHLASSAHAGATREKKNPLHVCY